MTQRADPPTRDHCLELMDRFDMKPNIRAHSITVCNIALAIGEAVRARGVDVDLPLVEAGALLHDITKTRSLKTREDHAQTGRVLLEELGFPRTGEIVGQHNLPKAPPDRLTPAEIVSYSDKRVVHDRPVTLDDRFAYLLQTYGEIPNAARFFAVIRRRMEAIERKIERVAGVSVDDIVGSGDLSRSTFFRTSIFRCW